MKIAVVGGTGLIGHQVVTKLVGTGHEVVSLSRSSGVDLTTSAGLDTALQGADAVVDVSNVGTISRDKAIEFFSTAATNLARAAEGAGVSRIVVLSIVGVDRIPFGYYEGKFAQENALKAGAVPVTVLRATQFHEFADQNLGRVAGPFAMIPRMRMRPVASSEVTDELVRLATVKDSTVDGSIVELAGPEQHERVDLARRVVKARRMRKLVIPLTVPGAAGKPMAGGGLLPRGDHLTGTITFEDWLASSL
ncbi:MAG TPA: NAD(P)H-binding protein [Terrimesophilobacter sp.]|nr:NAD(P)H-binding protein [Terrimesophilobacter sp.]